MTVLVPSHLARSALAGAVASLVVAVTATPGWAGPVQVDPPVPAVEQVIFCSLPLDGTVKAGRGWDVVPELHLRHAATPPTLSSTFDPVLAVLPEWAGTDLAWLSTAFSDDDLVQFGAALSALSATEVESLRGLLWAPPVNEVDRFGTALAAVSPEDVEALAAGRADSGGDIAALLGEDGLEKLPTIIGGRSVDEVRAAGTVLAAVPFRAVDPLKAVLSGIEATQAIEVGRMLSQMTIGG